MEAAALGGGEEGPVDVVGLKAAGAEALLDQQVGQRVGADERMLLDARSGGREPARGAEFPELAPGPPA